MPLAADPVELIRAFCAAWSRRDPAELAAYFAPDAVYHNIPMEPITGAAAIRTFLDRFAAGATQAEFEVLRITGNEQGDVMTERVDRFELGGKQLAIAVAGVFEVRDGKIAAWRDYFDLATWTKQLTG